MIARGHTRIAYAVQEGADGHYSATDRYEGYADAMMSSGLRAEKLVLPEPKIPQGPTSLFPPPGWEENGPVWATDAARTGVRPTAVIAYMGNVANFLLYLAAGHGLQAPRDLSVVTFEDYTSATAGLLVTTWRIPSYRLGQEAVRMLLARLADPNHAPQPPVVVRSPRRTAWHPLARRLLNNAVPPAAGKAARITTIFLVSVCSQKLCERKVLIS